MSEITTSANLWTPGYGILSTHVSWNDIEQAAQEVFDRTVTFGPNKGLRQIGEGNGFLSNIALIDADWQGGSESLPKQIVVKIPTCLNVKNLAKEIDSLIEKEEKTTEQKEELLMRFSQMSRVLHNREIIAYDLFHKYEDPLDKLKILTPYFQKQFSEENKLKGFISFEFVKDLYIRHCYHTIKPSDLSEVLCTMAKMQANAMKWTLEEKAKLPNEILKLYEGSSSSTNIECFLKSITKLLGPESVEVAQELLKHVDYLADLEVFERISKELGMEEVFVHGDLWSSNIMWKKTDEGIEFLKLIDFQLAHFGCPAEDFVRVFASTLSGYDFVHHSESLLEEFYSYFLTELNGETPPYTLEQLKHSFDKLTAHALIILFMIIHPIAEAGLKNNNDDNKLLEVLTEKLEMGLKTMLKSATKYNVKSQTL